MPKQEVHGHDISHWVKSEKILLKLIDADFEVSICKKALAQINSRCLGNDIETAKGHFLLFKNCTVVSQDLKNLLQAFDDEMNFLTE